MLADVVDAVMGVDTHRDVHLAEIAYPSGVIIATCSVRNTSAGHAELLGWARKHAPWPRPAACIEGTRSYGSGLTRAAAAAGLAVIECEQPTRRARRGKGKSDPIDAHLAVLTALRLDAGKLPTPRADGDREALRILLCARQELTTTATAQANRLLAALPRRRQPPRRQPRPDGAMAWSSARLAFSALAAWRSASARRRRDCPRFG